MINLSALISRVRGRFKRAPKAAPSLVWRTQFAGHPLSNEPCSALYHIARSPIGTLEIFEAEGRFLLHFPRSLRLPAELFSSLTAAKDRALTALISQEPDHDHQ